MILKIDSKSKKIYLQFKKIVQLEKTLKLFPNLWQINSNFPRAELKLTFILVSTT